MATVHTAYGPGEIVDRETVRGRTQYKVAGDGFEVWLDEAKLGGYTPPDTLDMDAPHWQGHDLGDQLTGDAFGGGYAGPSEDEYSEYADPRGRFDRNRMRTHEDYEGYGEDGSHYARRLAWAPMDDSNSTTLPYDPSPQHDAIGQSGYDDGSSTLQPIHHIDADERLDSSNSVSFEDEDDCCDEPGPNPDLFAKESSFDKEANPATILMQSPWVRERVKKTIGPKAYETISSGAVGHGIAQATNVASGQINEAVDAVSPGPGWGDLIKPASRHEANPAALLAPALLRAVGPAIARGVGGSALSDLAGQGAEAVSDFDTGGPEGGWGDLVKDSSYRPAGLSDRYIDITAGADYHNDPVAQFRHDPDAYINRIGHLMDEGLNPRFAEYMDLVEADSGVRTAAWKDVRKKAMRLKTSGAVHVKDIAPTRIMASVDGDNGTYDVVILKGATVGDQSIANWHCGCEWGRWAFKRKFSYVGRLCSHAYASYLTMQSTALKGQPRTKRGPSDMVIKKRNPRDRQYPMPVFAAGLKTADNLQNGPTRLTPDMVVNDTDDAHMFVDVTKDERDDTGPDDVVSEKDIVHFARLMRHCEVTEQPYPRQLVAFLARYAGCADDSSDDTQADYKAHDADDANEYLDKIRADGDRKQEEDFGSMAERVHRIQDAVEEARAHGADADRFVAMRKTAEPSSGDPGLDAYNEKGGIGYTQNQSGNGTYNFNRTQGDGKQRDSGGDPGSNAYAENGGITYMENADQPGTYSFQRSYPDGEGGTTTKSPDSDSGNDNPGGRNERSPEQRAINRTAPKPSSSPNDPDAGKDLSSIPSTPGKSQTPAAPQQQQQQQPDAPGTSDQTGQGGGNQGGGDGGGNASGTGRYTAPGGGQTTGPVADGGVAGAENGNNEAIKGNEYTVQAGDTLTDIAQRAYGDMNRYQDIAKANGITDVDNLEVGKTYKLDNAQGNNNIKGDATNPAGGGSDGKLETPDAGPAATNPATTPPVADTSSIPGSAGGDTSTATQPPAPASTTPTQQPLAAESGFQAPSSINSPENTSPGLNDPKPIQPAASRRRQAAPNANPADPNQGQNGTNNTTAPSTSTSPAGGRVPAQPGGVDSATPSLENDTYTDPMSASQGIQGGDSLRPSTGMGSSRNDGTQSLSGGGSFGGSEMGMGDTISSIGGGIGDAVGGLFPGIGGAISGISQGIGSAIDTFSGLGDMMGGGNPGGSTPGANSTGASTPGTGAGGGGARTSANVFSSREDFDDWVRYAYPTVEGEGDLEPHTHPFAGSGYPGSLEIGTSEEYADKARRKMDDVTDLGEGDLTKPMGEWQKQGSVEDDDPYREASIGYSTDDDSDIVRTFQAHLGDSALGAGAGQGAGRFDDIAGAAQGFLRTAGRNYSLAEQSELIREGDKGGARNLDSLDLKGTHYEDMHTLGW